MFGDLLVLFSIALQWLNGVALCMISVEYQQLQHHCFSIPVALTLWWMTLWWLFQDAASFGVACHDQENHDVLLKWCV